MKNNVKRLRHLHLGLALLLVAISFLPFASQPAALAAVNVTPGTYVFDFETLTAAPEGPLASAVPITEYTVGDLTMKISVTGGTGQAVIFDSATVTCGDDDLGSPNEDFGGPGVGIGGEATGGGPNQLALGNVLIIQEDSNQANCTPNDNGNGGTITFEFVQTVDKTTPVEVTVQLFELLDIDEDEGGGLSVTFFNGNTQVGSPLGSVGPGNNSFEQFLLNVGGVTKIVTTMGGSGAIPSVQVSVAETTADLGDYVWCDINLDGIQNDGIENGQNGIIVNLLDENGNPVSDGSGPITTTTADKPGTSPPEPGYYQFTNLDPGSYIVEFVAGVIPFTTPFQGVLTTADSNANATTGQSDLITLVPGGSRPDVDAGLNCSTVPVTIGYFQSAASGDTVDFTWQTATETSNAGFNLYGATDAGLVQLNESLIQSTVIDSVEPTDYAYSAVTSATSFYIEDVSIDGKTDQAGPFALGEEYGVYISTAVELEPVMYLPLIQH